MKEKIQLNKKRNIILYSFFRRYLLLFLIPIVLLSVYFAHLTGIVRNNNIEINLREIEKNAQEMESFFEEVRHHAEMIINNPQVSSFTKEENVLEYPNTYRAIELQNTLPDILAITDKVFDYFLFYTKSDVAINRHHVYTFKDFFSLYLQDQQSESCEEWIDSLHASSKRFGIIPLHSFNLVQGSRSIDLLSYTFPLPSYQYIDRSLLTIYIRRETLENMLPLYQSESAKWILNNDKSVLYYNGNIKGLDPAAAAEEFFSPNIGEQRVYRSCFVDGRRYMIFGYTSAHSQISYFSMLPIASLDAQIIAIISLFLMVVSGIILLGVLLSFFISRRQTKPIYDLITDLSPDMGEQPFNKNIFGSLKEFYRGLRDENAELLLTLQEQQVLNRNTFHARLLFGSFDTEEEIREAADSVDFVWRDRLFWVLLFRPSSYTDKSDVSDARWNVFSLALQEDIGHLIPDACPVNAGDGTIALILNLPADEEVLIQEYSEGLVARLTRIDASSLSICGGFATSELSKISASFEYSRVLLYNTAPGRSSSIIWSRKNDFNVSAVLDEDAVKMLGRCVLNGDEEGLELQLKKTTDQYFSTSEMNQFQCSLFVNELQVSLLRMIPMLPLGAELFQQAAKSLEKSQSLDTWKRITVTFESYRVICRKMSENKTRNVLDCSKVAAYIHSHYSDNLLSLGSTADAFNVSSTYLSTMFKQTNGVPFSTYLENLRIDKSKDLLINTEMSVKDIAEATGYTSINSFGRAFKRVVGVSPIEYKTHPERDKEKQQA